MKRQSRDARKRGVTVRLTPRDEALLKALARFRIARTSDLMRYAFRNVRKDTAATRLRRLYDAGYLSVRSQSVAEENLYSLGVEGRRFLRTADREVRPAPRGGLQHHLAIVRTWIDLAIAISETSRLRLLSVQPDWEFRKETGAAGGPVPDLLVRLGRENPGGEFREVLLAVEVDRGTESLRVLRRKLGQYELHSRGTSLGIAIVLTETFSQRRQAMEELLKEVWFGWNAVWTVEEGPGAAVRCLESGSPQTPLADSPCSKGREAPVSDCPSTSGTTRGGGL